MNERIKEISEQASLYAVSDNSSMLFDVWKKRYTEKFVELIVRECAKFLDENSGYDNSNNAWHPEPEDLLKHFGVKE